MYGLSRSKGILINGPMLQSKSNESASGHKYDNFTASNGWLKSFWARHQIKFAILHGESAKVSFDVVHQCLEELPNHEKLCPL